MATFTCLCSRSKRIAPTTASAGSLTWIFWTSSTHCFSSMKSRCFCNNNNSSNNNNNKLRLSSRAMMIRAWMRAREVSYSMKTLYRLKVLFSSDFKSNSLGFLVWLDCFWSWEEIGSFFLQQQLKLVVHLWIHMVLYQEHN